MYASGNTTYIDLNQKAEKWTKNASLIIGKAYVYTYVYYNS